MYDCVYRTYKHKNTQTHTRTQNSLFIHLAVQAAEKKARETDIYKRERGRLMEKDREGGADGGTRDTILNCAM